MKVKSQSEVPQSCLTLSDLMDCSLPGSSVHGIFQARVLECPVGADVHAVLADGIAAQATKETWIPSLGQEDSLEEGMATHSSIHTWRIPWTEEPGRL